MVKQLKKHRNPRVPTKTGNTSSLSSQLNAGCLSESRQYVIIYCNCDYNNSGMVEEGILYIQKKTGNWEFYQCFFEDSEYLLEKLFY